ncbi:MAG: DEAD/DEAH box helicase [Planctomycetota bacterium]
MPLASFHPTVAAWFRERLGAPTPPQVRAWPAIRRGEHVLVAAPTGSGKTLAAFLAALDDLLQAGDLPDETRVLYVSPLRALSNDVQKNLTAPLEELRARDASLPEVRVLVRTGDTPSSERARMSAKPPHVLVTTPESLYVLLTSEGGRRMLSAVRTVIVDEIHALLGDKRGAHLALSLERLDDLTRQSAGRTTQRIGLSATQKPLADVGRFLVGLDAAGAERPVTLIDEGHLRQVELSVHLPRSPLEAVCSHETWGEIHEQIAALVRAHKSTLVFVNTRKVCERTARELSRILGPEHVTSHHSSLSKERRLDAEERLKRGALRALVATASLELGIDIGDVDLVIQVGATRRIATLLQRVGRSGHGVGRMPKGALFPVSMDELTEAAALLKSVRDGALDHTSRPEAPLDILAQQLVAWCVAGPTRDEAAPSAAAGRAEDELFGLVRRAWPYRALTRERFDATVALHLTERGRYALLHRDPGADQGAGPGASPGAGAERDADAGVPNGATLRATRRARLVALTSGGAIPDRADYRVVMEPDGLVVGSVDEDFAIEASGGDVFQLGNMSWRLLRMQPGTLFVADAHGAPPSLPFWFGEAPSRSQELSHALGDVREHGRDPEWLVARCGLTPEAARVLAEFLRAGHDALGATPTQHRLVLERFFDESGGSQLVVHSLHGSRLNRAFGLALRKRFCRSFGFELQAAANEEAVLISLGPMHSFPLQEVFEYLSSKSVRALLVQALLDAPMFQTRWRWNVSRALLAPRAPGGKRLPPPIQRMRADDLLAAAFPDAVACGENLPPGDIDVPEGHPMVDQTIADCLTEAMDIEALEALLRALESGALETHCVDTAAPSPFARGALAIGPYGFLDDGALEERRVQAVRSGRARDTRETAQLGALDPDAVARVRSEAWPEPRDAEEVHEALTWIGYVTDAEAEAWRAWLVALEGAGRVAHADGRWYAAGATREPLALLRGRLEALGPYVAASRDEEADLAALEGEGVAVRVRLERDGLRVDAWCHRRLLARIQRYTLNERRQAVRPVSTAGFRRFLARWHGLEPAQRLQGPAGVLTAIERLAGWEAPAVHWEQRLLAARVEGYRQEWLDQLGLSGQVCWGRLWGSSATPVRSTPVAMFPRAELALWEGLSAPCDVAALSWPARAVHEALTRRGALFAADLAALPGLLPSDAERGIDELVGAGLVTSDAFAALRLHLRAPSKRPGSFGAPRGVAAVGGGRWSLFRAAGEVSAVARGLEDERLHEALARVLLRRYGVLFRALLARERVPVLWRDLARALRLMELRGDVLGGRFVDGYAGEQFADPSAARLLADAERSAVALTELHRCDPLALETTLVPGVGPLVRTASAAT